MTEPMLQFFSYTHLPTHLQAVSKPFCEVAESIVATLPRNPERSMALRKLLEAKDCAVRALIYKDEPVVKLDPLSNRPLGAQKAAGPIIINKIGA